MDLLYWTVFLLFTFKLTNGGLNPETQERRQMCSNDESLCIPQGSTEMCSGRGDCVCGACKCKERRGDLPLTYYGKWCECDDSACPSYNGVLCGGKGHGVCKCGLCKCQANFTGVNCGCSTKTDQCVTRDGKICAGHGTCECNKCTCNAGYGGDNCTECKGCDTCDVNKACVKCVMEKNDCKRICSDLKIAVVDEVHSEDNSQKTTKLCTYDDVTFVLQRDKTNAISIQASRMKGSPDNGGSLVMLSSVLSFFTTAITLHLKY